MGVKPTPADITNGFVHPSFGPPRGEFWKDASCQNYFVIRVNDPSNFYVSIDFKAFICKRLIKAYLFRDCLVSLSAC